MFLERAGGADWVYDYGQPSFYRPGEAYKEGSRRRYAAGGRGECAGEGGG